MKTSNIKAFTLVELATVLVIISLVIGGILVGQNVIKNSQLTTFVGQIRETENAFYSFQEKYAQLPGDMTNAYDYWGSDCAGSAGNCNGDGNSEVDTAETYKAWKHLALAEYIDGGFETLTNDSATCERRKNVPAFAIDKATAIFEFVGASETNDGISASRTPPLQFIVFGLENEAAAASCADSGILTSQDLYLIDNKIDDGLAYDGSILNSENVSDGLGCSTSTGTSDDGTYDLANSGQRLCRLFLTVEIQ